MYSFYRRKSVVSSLWIILSSSVLMFLWLPEAWGQKPGKEKILLTLPKEVVWKNKKNKKDTPSIRSFTLTAAPARGSSYPVQQIEILTIDKRYYPLSAKENVEEKWNFRQSQCPNSTLDIVYQNRDEKGLMIVYILRNPLKKSSNTFSEDESTPCDLPAWILLAAEGPTAFHAIEIQIPEAEYSDEIAKIWIDILKNRTIK